MGKEVYHQCLNHECLQAYVVKAFEKTISKCL